MDNTNEGFIQVATDGSGKRVRNVLLTEVQPDGTTQPIFMQVVEVGDPFTGKLVDLNLKPVLDELLEEQRRTRAVLQLMAGIAPDDAALVGGLQARSLLGVQAPAGLPVNAIGDGFGRQITVPWGARDMFAQGVSQTILDTAQYTLKAAEPNIYLDMVGLVINNTSATTATRVDVSDGTNTYSFIAIAGGPPVGFWGAGLILPASKSNTPWMIQASASVTDLRAFALFVRNK